MYLCEGIVDFDSRRHDMVGLVPGWSVLDKPRLSIGYRTGVARRSSFLMDAGDRVRGHEFHWSQMHEAIPGTTAAYELDGEGRLEGYVDGNLLATYLHVHFGTDARLARRFVAACTGGVQ
jgi:cobyrinic acid a,c-diamide synthase